MRNKKHKTSFNWQCSHCKKRTISTFHFQFDIPKSYSVVLPCSKCSKESRIWFSLTTEPIFTTQGRN